MLGVSLAVIFAAVVACETFQTLENDNKIFFWTYECVNNRNCRRTARPISTIDTVDLESKNQHTSLAACRLVCGDTAGLWPIPTGATEYSKQYVKIDPLHVRFETKEVPVPTRSFISEASAIFVSNLQLTCGAGCARVNSTTTIEISVESDNSQLSWETDESYELYVVTKEQKIRAIIAATTVYGARHALETLSQLAVQVVTPEGDRGLVILNAATIRDAPIFPHRGLLIDTARNFLPITDILRTVDALAATKMNVLHWHATDSQSFPLHIKSRPSMSLYGAYSQEAIYTLEDLGHVVLYSKFRGVRVILELDSPSHVGAGWEWGPLEGLGDLAVCVNRQPWREYCIQPPCGQINPVNPNTYEVLRDIYRDILDVIGTRSILHLGGDEVFINCWNSTPEITEVMKAKGMGRSHDDFLQLWGDFHKSQLTVLDEIKGANDSFILWSSALTSPEVISRHLDKNRFVVQTWVETSSTMPAELLRLGYRLIISTKNTWYLDHGFWGRNPYHTWRDAYNNRIPRAEGVLGGEACMWGEYVNAGGLDTKVWPRAAAVAERLWSDPEGLPTIDAEPRLQAQKSRMEVRGIYADALAPEWCNQHERLCI